MLAPILAAVLTFTSESGGEITLRGDGDRLVVMRGESVVASAAAAVTTRVVIRGVADRDDTLTVDLSQPLHLADGIEYDGGARGFDTLVLRGGSFREQRTTQLTPHDGVIDLDGLVIRYSNLEPITDTAPAASLTINGTAGNDSVFIGEGPIGTSTTKVSSPTFESVTFANKTNVTYDGLGGGDSVSISNPLPATGLQTFLITNAGTVSAGALIRYPSLGVSATGNISLNFPTNEITNFEAASQTGDVALGNSTNLTIGNVTPALAGLSGRGVSAYAPNLTVDAGAVVSSTPSGGIGGTGLHATTGALLVDGSVVANGGDAALSSNGAAGITINSSVTATTGDIYLQTSRLLINPTATLSAPAGTVYIQIRSFAPNIDLGSTTDASGTGLELSDAELDRITAATVSLETATGTITVSQPITYPTHVRLSTPNFFTATGSGSLSAPTLTFEHTGTGTKTWTITPSTIQIAGGAPVPYTATTLNILGFGGGPFAYATDTFLVTPSATTTINIDAGYPIPPTSPGDTLDFDLTGVLNPVLTATLTADGYQGSLTASNRQPVNFSEIETILDAPVDLGIAKSGSTTAVAGGPISYTIVVTNPGPIPVVNATVTDTFPSALSGVTWTCTASAGSSCTSGGSGNILEQVTLAAGGSVTFNVTATLAPSAMSSVSNTATVAPPAGSPETNGTDNTSTFATTVTTEAQLILTKTATSTSAFPGGDITYTITLRNAGPSDAQNVVLTDILPAGTSFLTIVAPPAYTCTTGATVTCSTATLAPSATADTFTLVVRVSPTTPPGTVISNAVTVTSTTTGPTVAPATANVTVIAPPAAVPTLSEWMLMLLAASLALVALGAARVD